MHTRTATNARRAGECWCNLLYVSIVLVGFIDTHTQTHTHRCNLLYVSTVLVGFIFLPKNVMLLIGVLTSVCAAAAAVCVCVLHL